MPFYGSSRPPAAPCVVVVHHDLGTVAKYFDRVVILNKHLVAEGPVEEAFTKENVAAAYGGTVAYLAEAGS